MTISCFVLFVLGALIELLVLIAPHLQGTAVPANPTWRERLFTPTRSTIALMVLAAALILLPLELTGAGHPKVYIDTPIAGLVMVLLALTVLAAAIMAEMSTPVINEQSILLVQLLLLVGFLLGENRAAWLPSTSLIVLAMIVSLVLLVWPSGLPPSLKAILYFWYLLSQLILPFQSGDTVLFRQADLSWVEAYSFGMLSVFLLLNGLLAMRFFLIVSALLRPRNRALVARHMPALFTDQQVSLPRYLLVVGLLVSLQIGNTCLHLIDQGLLLSLCSLLGVQIMSYELRWPTQEKIVSSQ